MALLSVKNLLLRFSDPALLDHVSFDIQEGERVCLMGRNGEGKSTLLKILSGEMEANSGEIIRKNGLRTSRLIQEIPAHIAGTVRDIVIGETPERHTAGEDILGTAWNLVKSANMFPATMCAPSIGMSPPAWGLRILKSSSKNVNLR